MEITIARTGGYAGLSEVVATIDTVRLDPKVKADVEAAVANAKFFALPERIQGKEIGADLQAYEVTITDGSRHHHVTFPDESTSVTAQLLALVSAAMAAR